MGFTVSLEIQAPLKNFPGMHVTRAHDVPSQGREVKTVSNWHVRNEPLGPCTRVRDGRGGGWE